VTYKAPTALTVSLEQAVVKGMMMIEQDLVLWIEPPTYVLAAQTLKHYPVTLRV